MTKENLKSGESRRPIAEQLREVMEVVIHSTTESVGLDNTLYRSVRLQPSQMLHPEVTPPPEEGLTDPQP